MNRSDRQAYAAMAVLVPGMCLAAAGLFFIALLALRSFSFRAAPAGPLAAVPEAWWPAATLVLAPGLALVVLGLRLAERPATSTGRTSSPSGTPRLRPSTTPPR